MNFQKLGQALVVLLVAVFVGWAGYTAAETTNGSLAVEQLQIRSGENLHMFTVEVAQTDRERSKGLMFREQMDPDKGMLFVFEGEAERFFWMKNTPLPLDIIYIDSQGKIVSIIENTTPYSEAILPSIEPATYVLELNAGSAVKFGFGVGDSVESDSILVE